VSWRLIQDIEAISMSTVRVLALDVVKKANSGHPELSLLFSRDALQKLIADGIVRVTSNPIIVQQAIAGSDLYCEQLRELSDKTDDPREIFSQIAGATSRTRAIFRCPSLRAL